MKNKNKVKFIAILVIFIDSCWQPHSSQCDNQPVGLYRYVGGHCTRNITL